MSAATQTSRQPWVFWAVAAMCAIVNVGLLAEVFSMLLTESNLAQLEMSLLLIFMLFGLPVLVVSLIVISYLLWRRSHDAGASQGSARITAQFVIAIANVAVPLLFLLFFVSVKVFGYYWI